MKRFLLWTICLMVASLPTVSSFAKAPRVSKAKTGEHHDTVISTVSPDSITITEDKAIKSFKITQFTEVTLRGQRATVADLKPGMTVEVTMGSDALTAGRIAAGDSPVHDAPARK